MATKEQKKQQKKKTREKEVYKKVLLDRGKKQAKASEENALFKKTKRIEKLKKEMGEVNAWSDEALLNMDDKTLSQLEHNAKILKALEDEYEETNSERQKLNDSLESDGFLTLDEKLGSLHNKMVEQATAMYQAGGLPDFQDPSEESSSTVEVAEVGVIKAPVAELS